MIVEVAKDRLTTIMNTQLNTVKLSSRCIHALQIKGIRTIKDFVMFYGARILPDENGNQFMEPAMFSQKNADVLGIRNFGVASYRSIYNLCHLDEINKLLRKEEGD